MKAKKYFLLFFLCCRVAIIFADDDNVRPRVGLVLSGGGAKGMAHVGALKVIEELGIPIDYIGGTSMGSIVGGLCALGYNSVQLENYIKEADWEDLLTDRISRRHVSIYEKGERKQYWLQFPIRERRIELPMGILTGQNVSNLFTELASPAYAQPDFSKFTIPFLCVATDIETGTEVVLEKGNLVKAMRASMAIPSVFIPEMIDSKRLYDGGLTNNFPANLVKNKGMDILIGVDVGSNDQNDGLKNIYQVMEQVVFMSSVPLREANRALCNVLIVPDISEYSASSFNAADSLVIRGERAARQHYDELKNLADMLQSFEPDKPKELALCPQPLHSFYVKEVQINGLKYISEEFFMQKLALNFPAELTFAQLNRAIEKLKGTQIFHSIVYHLNPLPDSSGVTSMVELRFDCVEHSTDVLRVGLHSDREFRSALLLNLSLRNFLLNNSKASAKVSIGANPSFSLSFLHSPRFQMKKKTDNLSLSATRRQSPDWLFFVDGYRFDAYHYSENQRTMGYNFSDLSSGIQLLFSPTINNMFGVGVNGEYSYMKTYIGGEIEDVKSEYLYMSYRLFYERDTYNEDYFPTSGRKIRMEATYHKGLSNNVRNEDGFPGVLFRSNFALTPIERWTLHLGVEAGAVFGSDVPLHYMMRLGGAPDRQLYNHISFQGLSFMQKYSKNAWVTHLNSQIRLWNNIYVTLRSHLGKAEQDLPELFTMKDFLLGYGVSAQYNSVVGPMGFTLSSSNATRSLMAAFHLGFWF